MLIIEDEAAVSDVLREFLDELGHEVVNVPSAEDALTVLSSERPDALLLDVNLPGMNGVDFLRLQTERACDVPTVVVSGVATESQARECLRLGAFDFIGKPIEFERLREVLMYLDPDAARTSTRERVHGDGARVDAHLRILHTIGHAVSRSLDVDEILRIALDALTNVTGHESSSLHLLSPDGSALHLQGDRGLRPQLRELNRTLPVGRGLIGIVASTGRTMCVTEVSAMPDLLPSVRQVVEQEGIHAFVCVAIQTRGRILGTLSLGRRTTMPFADAEIALVEASADQIALALENARLYGQTRRQLDDLKQAETQLAEGERLSTLGTLAAGIAHEINNPLTAILGQAQLLMTRSEQSPSSQERLRVIIQETSRAARLLQNLLQLSRRQAPQHRPCSLEDQVRLVLELKAHDFRRAGIDVVTVFGPVRPIWADEDQIRQVVLNLAQNAQHALAAHDGERVLTVRTTQVEDTVRLELCDTGPGIPRDVLPRIFDAFFTTKPVGEGTGLGLWVSANIIEQHGGKLTAENRASGGAAFVIELPVARRLP